MAYHICITSPNSLCCRCDGAGHIGKHFGRFQIVSVQNVFAVSKCFARCVATITLRLDHHAVKAPQAILIGPLRHFFRRAGKRGEFRHHSHERARLRRFRCAVNSVPSRTINKKFVRLTVPVLPTHRTRFPWAYSCQRTNGNNGAL